MRRAAALLLLLATLAATPAWAGESHKIKGTFTLTDGVLWDDPDVCWGSGGYDDIRDGLQVVVRDGNGRVLAKTVLRDGTYQPMLRDCEFSFAVKVPEAKFYAVEVGHRGELTFSLKEMQRAKWKVEATLG